MARGAASVRKLRHLAGELGVLEHQHDARRPTLRAAFELRSGGRGQLVTSKLGDLCQLRRLETQAVTSDSCELAGHPQPREAGQGSLRLVIMTQQFFGTWANAASSAVYNALSAGTACRLSSTSAIGPLARAKKLTEELAREQGDVGAVLRRELRQLRRALAYEFARRVTEIVEERGDVGIVGVDLVPEHPPLRAST